MSEPQHYSWLSNHCFSIRVEWSLPRRSRVGWVNRFLCLINLRIVQIRDTPHSAWRWSVVRWQKHLGDTSMPIGFAVRIWT